MGGVYFDCPNPLMRSRRSLSIAGMAALAAMLFAQAALALAACDGVRIQSHASMVAVQDSVPCHEPDTNAGLCLAHCQHADQTLDKHQVKVPPVVLVQIVVAGGLQASTRPGSAAMRSPARAAGPPLRILFQSLLI